VPESLRLGRCIEILIIEIGAIWLVIASITGLGAASAIRRGERQHRDEIPTALFIASLPYKSNWTLPFVSLLRGQL
jgi:hypothetical protein